MHPRRFFFSAYRIVRCTFHVDILDSSQIFYYIQKMPSIDSNDIYYPVSWIKTTTDMVLNLFSTPQKTKRSLPEEAECGSLDGIKCWLREGK